MHGDGEAEAGRLGDHALPMQAAVAGTEDAVVVLHPEELRARLALHQAVRVLDRRLLALLRRHVVGAHASGGAGPAAAVVVALPDAAARHRDGEVATVAWVDADGMDAGMVVAAAEPLGAFGSFPEFAVEAPAGATVVRAEQAAGDGPGPQRAGPVGAAWLEDPQLL